MIEGEDDRAYRVHLLKGSWGLLRAHVWGKAVEASAPTYFDGDDVRKKRGRRGWPVDYWDAIRSPKFEIWGQPRGEGDWRPLSRDLLGDQRLARMIAAELAGQLRNETPIAVPREMEPPDPVDRAVEQLLDIVERVVPAPGIAEAVVHLLDHEHMRRDHALRAMRKMPAYAHVEDRNLNRLKGDGRRRLREPDKTCRFCSA